jgi:hypothetical protein
MTFTVSRKRWLVYNEVLLTRADMGATNLSGGSWFDFHGSLSQGVEQVGKSQTVKPTKTKIKMVHVSNQDMVVSQSNVTHLFVKFLISVLDFSRWALHQVSSCSLFLTWYFKMSTQINPSTSFSLQSTISNLFFSQQQINIKAIEQLKWEMYYLLRSR